jgi:alanine racemase
MPATQARLTIDLDALAANHALCRTLAGAAEVAPVVKADAYGLGLAPIARRLRAEGAERFFVARVAEGEALRRALGAGPAVYVLDGCPPGAATRLIAADLTPVLNSLEQIADWTRAGGGEAGLHVDTGMNRLGLRPEEARDLARTGVPPVSLVMSHLACGSSPGHPMNQVQAEAFDAVRGWFPNARASLANSGGLFQDAAFALDIARPGIALFGGGPFGEADPRLTTVATLEAPILQVRTVPAGESIGYGAGFVAQSRLSVAVIAAGYADGVLRAQSPAGYGWLDGARRRMLGRISMDLIAIDVSDCPAARAGDMVQLLGPHVLLDDVATASKTVAYEILTRMSGRANRHWHGRAG